MKVHKLKKQVLDFIAQGSSTHLLALATSSGFLIATFPILGTHTALSFVLIFILRLNPAAIFLFSNVFFPVYFVLLWPFYESGVWLLATDASIQKSMLQFELEQLLDPEFYHKMIKALIYLLTGWVMIAFPIALVIYIISNRIYEMLKRNFWETSSNNHN